MRNKEEMIKSIAKDFYEHFLIKDERAWESVAYVCVGSFSDYDFLNESEYKKNGSAYKVSVQIPTNWDLWYSRKQAEKYFGKGTLDSILNSLERYFELDEPTPTKNFLKNFDLNKVKEEIFSKFDSVANAVFENLKQTKGKTRNQILSFEAYVSVRAVFDIAMKKFADEQVKRIERTNSDALGVFNLLSEKLVQYDG